MCGGMCAHEVCFGNVQKDSGGGGHGHEIKCSSDTEFTSAVPQKTGYFMHWWQHQFLEEKRCLSITCFRLVLLALTHCVVNEAFKKKVLGVASWSRERPSNYRWVSHRLILPAPSAY